jgi:hypothetical protein
VCAAQQAPRGGRGAPLHAADRDPKGGRHAHQVGLDAGAAPQLDARPGAPARRRARPRRRCSLAARRLPAAAGARERPAGARDLPDRKLRCEVVHRHGAGAAGGRGEIVPEAASVGGSGGCAAAERIPAAPGSVNERRAPAAAALPGGGGVCGVRCVRARRRRPLPAARRPPTPAPPNGARPDSAVCRAHPRGGGTAARMWRPRLGRKNRGQARSTGRPRHESGRCGAGGGGGGCSFCSMMWFIKDPAAEQCGPAAAAAG